MIRVYPVAGRLVRHPDTRAEIAAEGIEVAETDIYWARRLMQGDVVTEKPAPEKAAPTPAPADSTQAKG